MDEIMVQLKEPLPLGVEATVFMPYEVGDYSVYIHENLDGVYQIGIINDKGDTYRSKEILASSEGSIVYFNEKIIPDIKVGYIYRGWMQSYFFDNHNIAEELFREGIISLDQLLNIYKNTLLNKK